MPKIKEQTKDIPIELKEFLHNLKDRNWEVNSAYKIDENEAMKIIKAIEKVEVEE